MIYFHAFVLAVSIVSLLCAMFAAKYAAHSLIEIEAMKRSTHQVSFIDPSQQNFSSFTDEIKERFSKTNDDPLDSIQ